MATQSGFRTITLSVAFVMLVVAALGGSMAEAAPFRQTDIRVLVYGQTVDGTLTAAQPSALYAFDAQAGDVITVSMVVTGEGLDPFLVLNDANRNPLATDDNSGGGLNARLTYVIPETGRFIIQATHAGGVIVGEGGAFSLNLTAAVSDGTLPVETAPTEVPSELSDGPTMQGDTIRLRGVQSGSTVRDSLDRQVAFRLYWFEGHEGDQIGVIPEQLADFQPLLVLYDANFAELQRAMPGVGLRTALSQDGVYFLAVSLPDAGSAGGAYGLLFEQSRIPAAQDDFVAMTYGESQRGNIDAAFPAMTYRFRGSEGDAVTITMSRAGGDLNAYLYLLTGDGQLLYEDNDSGGDNGDARIVYTLPQSGEFLIVATRVGQAQGTTSGSYLLELLSDAPPPVEAVEEQPTIPDAYAELPQIAYGQTVEGALGDTQFMDVYVFWGSEGEQIEVEMDSLNPNDANGLDPFLILLDSDRIPLAEHDDIVEGENRNARIEFTLPRTGYYAVVATRFDQETGTSTGPYTLALNGPEDTAEQDIVVQEGSPLSALSPSPLASGTPAQGTFATTVVAYGLTAAAGSLIDLAVTTDPGLDSVLILADDHLNEILSSGTGMLTGVPLPQAGSYVVLVAPRFGPVSMMDGGYILALTESSGEAAGAEGSPGVPQITYGETVSDVIDDDTFSHTYTFSGLAGQTVRITMEAAPGSSLDCYLELQDSSGVVMDANDDIDPGVIRDSRITIELPADDAYVLIASRYVGPDSDPTFGAFYLTLELMGQQGAIGRQESTPIAYGQTLVGEITDEQYLLFYVFDGTGGDMVTISIDNLSGNLDSVLYLYQSSGDNWIELADNDDSLVGGTYEALLSDIVLPQTGKYLIAVSRYGLDSERTAGTFAITLTRE